MADVKWIKIMTDVFDDEKILLIESLPEADSIIVIWFKLLCLAGKQNNSGVFMMSNGIPYTDSMLATIFRRKEATVKMALQTFEQFGMIEVIDDAICIPNWGKHQSLEQIEARREYQREYQRNYRLKQKELIEADDAEESKCLHKRLHKHNVNTPDKNREEEKRIEEDKKREEKSKPSVYYPLDEQLNKAFADYIDFRKKIKKPMTDRAIELAMSKLDKMSGGDNDVAIQILEQSILNGWQALYPLKNDGQKREKSVEDYVDEWRNA